MVEQNHPAWIIPEWPAPPNVRAYSTTRCGGVSEPPYDSLNLGAHVGDDPRAVEINRQRLVQTLGLPAMPLWLNQVHGIDVVDAARAKPGVDADASFTAHSGVVCAVMTADCLPVLLCDAEGGCVAAAHAGWRGLLNGVIEATVRAMRLPGKRLMAWLGPAIGPRAFEVGEEVRRAFVEEDAAAALAFKPSLAGRHLADIYSLAHMRLARMGMEAVYGGHWCTYSDPARFYSYRRDGVTGRMATMIWMNGAQRHE